MKTLMDTIYFMDGPRRRMKAPSSIKLKKVPEANVLKELGIGGTKYKLGVKKGVLPRLVDFGPRSKGIYEHELDLLIKAYKDNASTRGMEEIVSRIHKSREAIQDGGVDFSRYVL